MRILVTGGAGYIGSSVVRLLISKGHQVHCLDNLSFGAESIADLLADRSFTFFKGDVRSKEDCQEAVKGCEGVIHLASIVGDPACAKQPDLARSVNIGGTKNLFETASSAGAKRFVFASTCSNYGKMEDPSQLVTETSELRPVSLYAESKVEVEKFLLAEGKKTSAASRPTVLRFSTVYGLSSRPRFDLTVNEFTKELSLGRKLTIFGEQFWRPYCHVNDLAKSTLLALTAPASATDCEVYNVGDTRENYQKQMIVDEIRKVIPEAQVEYVTKNEDPRDYRVAFEKIEKGMGFEISYRVQDGIRQIHTAVKSGFFTNPDNPSYKNV